MCNKHQAICILEEVFNVCNPILRHIVCDAYLYGSFARGDYHAESDVDILLAVELDPEEIAAQRMALSEQISELSLKHDITVSVAVKPISQFLRYADASPYYRNIIQEGIRYVQ